MSKDTFKRKEIKYLLDAAQHERLRSVIHEQLPPAVFGTGRVSSLYLDTADRSVIARSLEKPIYKEKMRVCWYGTPDLMAAHDAFIELKKKCDGIVYKRRLQVSSGQVHAFLSGMPCVDLVQQDTSALDRQADAQRIQIARELDAARERVGGLRPSVIISCDRTSFGTDDENGLRITFDEHLHAQGLFDGESRLPLMAEHHAIMEVKCTGAYPFWLVSALNGAKAYPASFSKYGRFYALTQPHTSSKEGSSCLMGHPSITKPALCFSWRMRTNASSP